VNFLKKLSFLKKKGVKKSKVERLNTFYIILALSKIMGSITNLSHAEDRIDPLKTNESIAHEIISICF
jgi:hypothetical protein